MDREFGTGCNKAMIDLEADYKVMMAVHDKKFKPFELVHHMIAAWIYVLG